MEDASTTSKPAKVLERLKDGKWHSIEEVRTNLRLDGESFLKVFAFLKEYNFIIVDEESGRVKLEEDVRKFLVRTTTS